MITRKELAQDRDLCNDKAMGCLTGLAVGDAMGDIGRNDACRQRYGIVTNLYAEAGSTDDTEFALLTVRTLLDCRADLTVDVVVRSWQKYILDQGGVYERAGKPLHGAVENLKRGILPPLSGIDNVLNNDDGAAMRIAPIGIVCAGEPERAAALAEIEAQISHHADGVWAAQAVAASVAVAMVDGTTDEIVEAGIRQIPSDSWLGRAMARAMSICDQEGSIENAWEWLHTELWTPVHSASPEAVPQIYGVFRLTDGDFRQGMFWGGNFGRDADTIGAVIGALAGARHGIAAIPESWVEKVRRPSGVCLKFAAPAAEPTEAPAVEPTEAPEVQEPVTIEWWTVDSEEYTEQVQRDMAAAFEAAHPNIKVKVTVLPESGFSEKMTTALGAGEGARPDAPGPRLETGPRPVGRGISGNTRDERRLSLGSRPHRA